MKEKISCVLQSKNVSKNQGHEIFIEENAFKEFYFNGDNTWVMWFIRVSL